MMISRPRFLGIMTDNMEKGKMKQERALRRFARFADIGVVVIASVLTGGVMTPAALAALAAVCQAQKN